MAMVGKGFMMNHKGYVGRVEFDDEAGIYHGDILGTQDVVTFQGKSVEEIRRAMKESVADYLEMCRTHGKKPAPIGGREGRPAGTNADDYPEVAPAEMRRAVFRVGMKEPLAAEPRGKKGSPSRPGKG